MYTKNCNLDKDKDKILEAIKEIVEPIANTMSPRGGNVLLRDENNKPFITNDGATICKYIQPSDELKRLIIDAIIESSEQTNKTAGDATSTTILLNGAILELFIELNTEEGTTHFEFIKALKRISTEIVKELELIKLGGNNNEGNMDDIKRVAYVSANNQQEIADVAVEVAVKAGEYGIIKYDDRSSSETRVQADNGFIIPMAIPSTDFLNKNTTVSYNKMKVFITDGKLFYQEDLNQIIDSLTKDGTKDIMIVAKEFSAKIPQIIYNVHTDQSNEINILPIALSNKEVIHDLAAYLDVDVYTESKGKISGDINNYITHMDSVGGTMQFVVVQKKEDSKRREERTDLLKSLLKDSPNDELLKGRLAWMTSGIVTLFVGGDTDIEKTEKKLKFEDAILASQKAMVYGYLPGGGTSMLKVRSDILILNTLESKILDTICTANFKQILTNSGIAEDLAISDYDGLDATSGEWVNMKEVGIFDSYKAVEQSLLNAVSTSTGLISAMSNTIIIKDNQE